MRFAQVKQTANALYVFIRMYMRGMTEYRGEFFGSGLMVAITNGIFYFTLMFLATKHGSFGGLDATTFIAALATGFYAFMLGGNFFVGTRKLGERVVSGKLDQMLFRPMPLFIQAQMMSINKSAAGEFLFAIVFAFFIEPAFWPKIILFAITGAIILNVWCYCVGLLAIYTDIVHDRGAFDAYVNLKLYPTKIFDPIVQFIALFVIPGGMMSFIPYYAAYTPALYYVYFGFVVGLCVFAYLFTNVSLKRYTGASA